MNWLFRILRACPRQLTALLAVVFTLSGPAVSTVATPAATLAVVTLAACNSYVPGYDDCLDSKDNDFDGLVDSYDPGCKDGGDENLNGGSETLPDEGTVVPTESESCADQYLIAVQTCEDMGEAFVDYDCAVTDGVITTLSVECTNSQGQDNDGDGEADITIIIEVVVENNNSNTNENNNSGGDDTGGGGDTNEPTETDCSDGSDNDGDELVDMDDPGCESESDNSEVNSSSSTDCSDGTDNDGDELVDMDDPGCSDASDDSEVNSESFINELGDMSCCVDTDGDESCDRDHGDIFADSFVETLSGYNEYTSALWSSYNALGTFCVEYADGTWDDVDDDGDGYSEDVGDCNDGNPEIRPGATEICDGYDNDCNRQVDEGAEDSDSDGYEHPGCSAVGDDCRDGDASSYPGATESCDDVDHDCSGYTKDVDADGDGFAHEDCGSDSAEIGPDLQAGDCFDDDGVTGWLHNSYFYPGADEYADWADQDCDGVADDGCTEAEGDYAWYYDYAEDTSYMQVCTP